METTETWPRFLTIAEAARYTNLPVHYWYRMTSEGRAPGLIRWGSRQIRIDRLALESWISEAQMEDGGNGQRA